MLTAPGARWQFEAIGTVWSIDTADELSASARARVAEVIDRFDREWSRFREDSLVSQLAVSAGAIAAPDDTVAMLDAYVELSAATAGAVNPLVGASLDALGYDRTYSLRAGEAEPAPEQWRQIVQWDAHTLSVNAPVSLDVGALGKGRLVDLVLACCADVPGGVTVDAGGDLAVRGRVERVGLEHPFDPSRAIGVIEIDHGALCASATNRRAWGDGLHHVLDARTGQPVRAIAATWAVAPTAMRADAAATALFFEGGDALAARWGVEWVRMSTDGGVEWSRGSKAELFT